MNEQLKNDLLQLNDLLEKVKNQGLDYLNSLDQRPTSVKNFSKQVDKLIDTGIGTVGALDYFNEKFEPIIVSSSGPRYWGYVTGGSTPASIAGDWLTSIYDQNTQETKAQGDISLTLRLKRSRCF